jgi:signal transduction histidine kinase
VAKILASGRRAADLVRQLLAFSRKQIIQPQLVNLNEVVAKMDRLLRRTIGEHILMETALAPDLWSVKMDPAQLEQIIVNLAGNARDAMPDGGRLVIETDNVVVDETYTPHLDAAAERPDLQPGDYVLLSVSDTGAGMDQEVKDRIFEPFFTTKGVGEGAGLGLSSVYGVAKQNGGDIHVQSEQGRGTTFRIYLPRAGRDTAIHLRSVPADDLPRGSETVLLVEDEATALNTARSQSNSPRNS